MPPSTNDIEKQHAAGAHGPPQRSTMRSVLLIITCTFAMLVNSSNNTSVAIALPTIGAALNIQEAQLQWLVSAYSLSSGCLLILFGRLADLHGRKRTFLAGSMWLAAWTLGCGFAQTEIELDVLRGLQGVGVAASIPASLGILAHAFPPGTLRSIAFATFAAGAPLGAFTGMALGAVMTQLSAPTWRSNFFLSTGLTVLYIALGWYAIDDDEPQEDRRVDWLGAFLVTAGLVLVVFVLSDGEVAPGQWATGYIIALLIIGCLFLGVFMAWQHFLEAHQLKHQLHARDRTYPPPLIPPALWTRSAYRLTAVMVVALLTWASFLGWNFWTQLYYQQYEGLSPVGGMLRMFPMFVTGIICNIIVVMIVAHVPVVYILASGTLITACASIFFALIPSTTTSTTYWAYGFPSAIFSVFGADFVFAAGTIFVARVVKPEEQSLAGGLFQTMTQLGTALGVTVTTIVFNRVVAHDARRLGLDPASSSAEGGVPAHSPPMLAGYRAAQWTAFAFGAVATLVTLATMSGVGIVGDRKGTPSPSNASPSSVDSPSNSKDPRANDSKDSKEGEGEGVNEEGEVGSQTETVVPGHSVPVSRAVSREHDHAGRVRV
ncbi:MFS general substrate transporter [Pleurotus eryngii]|uniref:MFS general substrate transporter n=1 Tax=Pleurotus eryngii TaxID=5323 RepID=A0A9P6DI80_PLEER|nr:MFS general substrate transporter [Pleurotus eryngii]